MTTCSICGEPNYLDTDAHPCCVTWQRLEPGRPCGGCAASRAHAKKRGSRKSSVVTEPLVG